MHDETVDENAQLERLLHGPGVNASTKAVQAIMIVMAVVSTGCGDRPVERLTPELPELYSSSRLEATVIDSDSGAPVSGAVVVAVWRKISIFVQRWDGIYLFAETTTDSDGRFIIHRWGPRPAPPFAMLDRRDPEIWVLKNGYLVGYFDNEGAKTVSSPADASSDGMVFVKLPPNKIPNTPRGAYARSADAGSIWNGKTLMLERARSAEQQARSLAVANPLDPYFPPKLFPIPAFWAEWEKARQTLPPALREQVPFPPRSVVDYAVTSP